ncbi:glycoside hydrolase family 81 protein [Cucurbitaria berberidis CBS 394.84]|uniref:glucan endo-1,3-beta-D-glucosidase n=1 Tax=Cucurbitaria berberidis CBS 394.84 TaxID=1168544 RepID=A0A9P4GGL0_9PLEO|nr:glycoside hydrolase family 81 protein [Cucurbitaria berberidis CBS 394.84]KAF1845071.1 glycoside hydrolase family 81 protein [Cucurbitaria berberidis CBS 394.84]
MALNDLRDAPNTQSFQFNRSLSIRPYNSQTSPGRPRTSLSMWMSTSYHGSALSVLLFTAWTTAIPLEITSLASEDVVWETVFITEIITVYPKMPASLFSTERNSITTVWQSSTAATYEAPKRSGTTDNVHGTEKVSASLTIGGSGGLSWTSDLLKTSTSTSQWISSSIGRSEFLGSISPPTPLFTTTLASVISLSSPISTPSGSDFDWPQLPTTNIHSTFSSIAKQPGQSPTVTSMGQSLSKPTSSRKGSWRDSFRDTRKGILTSFGHSTTAVPNEIPPDNIFVPIQKDSILSQIPIGRHHPVPKTGVEDDDKRTMHTNKFYANAFLGQQNMPIWTHPYSIWWGKGWNEQGVLQTWGMNIAHIEESDIAYGLGDPTNVYTNPPHKQSLVLSAAELDSQTILTTDTHLPFSVNINIFSHSAPQEPKITFPVVQGMSFVTAGYRNATPTIHTGGKGFVDCVGPIPMGRTTKYRVRDMDGRDWVIYVNPVIGLDYDGTKFLRLDPNTLLGPAGFKGTIQVARNPLGAEGEALYDKACGAFVYEASITAVAPDSKGAYSFNYTKIGSSPLLMFVLPHHLQSLDPELRKQVTKLQLRSTTKGMATAIWAEKLTFIEPNLPTTMHFGPWNPTTTAKVRYPPDVLALIAAVAERDLRRAMTEPIPPDSMYYAGKSLAKFATIVWVIKDVLGNDTLTTAGLDKLKQELARYISNQQLHPLYYDDSWKGIVSNAGFTDPGADFGNTYYNDHHFHFGYFVYTAAVIGYLDAAWLTQGDNKAWTNMLVKDFAESDYHGRDYPFSRSFDWWHGHSWAKGLFESADGKDQESTSEDGFASFAVKIWGRVSGDVNMEKRGNLMLAIQARSFNAYFYLQATNTNHPARFLGNKVSGILFENKVDYATYFGTTHPLIHGIHMVPINPSTAYTRPRAFVAEEWDAFFSGNRALLADGGWRGILYANLALVDAKASFLFFRDGVGGFWDERWIDGGASRTWYLVWAAAMVEFGKR